MKQFLLILSFMLVKGALLGQNVFHACGFQAGHWNYDTVYVNCDVTVPAGLELSIQAGTRVVFRGHYSLHVQGIIKAIGTASDSIHFTVSDTSGFGNIHSNSGGWNGLRFEDTPIVNDSSVFEFCRFSFGKATGDSVNCYGGAIRALRTNNIVIRNSSFLNNYAFYWGGAVYAFKTNILMEHVRVAGNRCGNDGMIYGYGGGLCFVSSEPDLKFMLFENNISTGIGGAASFEYSRPLLLNAVFRNNFSGLGGALGFLRSEPDRMIANLLITNNAAKFFGGGIANVTASPVMTNLTIVNNYAAMGGGFYCNEFSHAKIYNSILWNNSNAGLYGSQVWIWDVNSMPEFKHCVVQDGIPGFGGSTFIGIYENCTENDPGFVAPQEGNFRINYSGSAFNSGTSQLPTYPLPAFDLDQLPRITHKIPDIGAYEFNGPVSVESYAENRYEISFNPNPANAFSVLTIKTEKESRFYSKILDINGKVLDASTEILIHTGVNNYTFSQLHKNTDKLPAGLYILQLILPDTTKSIRILVQ